MGAATTGRRVSRETPLNSGWAPINAGVTATRGAFLITAPNPKAIIFYLAFFPQFIKSSVPHPLATFATLAGTVALITAIYCTPLCAFAAHVSHRFGGNQSAAVWLQGALGVGLMAFGVSLFRLEHLPL